MAQILLQLRVTCTIEYIPHKFCYTWPIYIGQAAMPRCIGSTFKSFKTVFFKKKFMTLPSHIYSLSQTCWVGQVEFEHEVSILTSNDHLFDGNEYSHGSCESNSIKVWSYLHLQLITWIKQTPNCWVSNSHQLSRVRSLGPISLMCVGVFSLDGIHDSFHQWKGSMWEIIQWSELYQAK